MKNLRRRLGNFWSQNGCLRCGWWTVRISKTCGGEIQTCQISELGGRAGKTAWQPEPRLGFLGEDEAT